MARVQIRREPSRRRRSTPPSPTGKFTIPASTPIKKRAPRPKVVDIEGQKFRPTLVLDTFFKFVSERYQVHRRRLLGRPPPWTTDPILDRYPFTNVFRVLDRVTQYILQNVIAIGDQSLHEQCFRLMLFRSFNKIETWEYLVKKFGNPTWRDFDINAYERVLLQRMHEHGIPLYGSAYIIPSPKLGSQANASNHLRLIQFMMEEDLPSQLQKLGHLKDAHGRISLYPGMGDFTALQLLLDLNMTPHFNYSEDEWVALGPGSLECLRKMFGNDVRGHELEALRYLHRTQLNHFARLFTPPDAIPRLIKDRPAGMSMVDIEHALCECEKYSRAYHPDIQGRRQRVGKRVFSPRPGPITADVPVHWRDPKSKRRKVFAEPAPFDVDGEMVYEVSHIVAEKGTANVKNRLYLVRWVGYGPDDDTWERRGVLATGAPVVLEEWETTRDRIQARILEYQEMGIEYKPAKKTKKSRKTL